jgi:uncharacterized protein YqjF (DUF2071 family)
LGSRPFLTAQWRHLVMASYEIDAALLEPYVPSGTTPDSWMGGTFVSLVAFRFLDTRVLGLPIPLHRNFDEVNLRFYVRRVVGSEVRRGVVFLREVVPRRAIAAVARLLYNEPYIAVPMRSVVQPTPPPSVEYRWRLEGSWHSCAATATGPGILPQPETFEAYIAERNWGYTRQRGGGTIEYRVEHPRWTVWRVTDFRVPAELTGLCDRALASVLVEPRSVLLADGAPVTVSSPRRLVS